MTFDLAQTQRIFEGDCLVLATEVRDGAGAEISRLTARVAELEGALKPLADMAERYDPDDGDDGQLECWSGLAVPKIHHLRTARAALSTHTEEPKT